MQSWKKVDKVSECRRKRSATAAERQKEVGWLVGQSVNSEGQSQFAHSPMGVAIAEDAVPLPPMGGLLVDVNEPEERDLGSHQDFGLSVCVQRHGHSSSFSIEPGQGWQENSFSTH